MKKIALILSVYSILTVPVLAAEPSKEMFLKVQFDSAPNASFYNEPIHVNKTLEIDLSKNTKSVVMEETKIVDDFPVTLTMLVKPEVVNNEATLQFFLLSYGAKQHLAVISAPKVIVRQGQHAELRISDEFKLQAKATWTHG